MRQTLKTKSKKANIIRKYATQKAEINLGQKSKDKLILPGPIKAKKVKINEENKAKIEPHPQKIDVSSQRADVHW